MMMRKLAVPVLLTLLLANASCKRLDVSSNQNSNDGKVAVASGAAASTPPFATKEPERYQATRLITSSSDAGAGSRTLIARDGERRREDYESGPGGERIAYLQLPEGSYVLLPAKKLYAELKPGTGDSDGERAGGVPQDFSPEKLLGEALPESRYERLGEENIEGRATVKYRVTVRGKAGGQVTTESIVWVDEGFGMPVKSETTSTGGVAPGLKVTMELRDIKETIDAGLLELPPGYKRVAPGELFASATGGDGGGRSQPAPD